MPGTRYALKQLQLVKEMALVQLELTQAKSLNPTLKPQRGHSPGIRVSDKQDKEMKCKPSPKEPRRLGHWLCDPIVEYTALDRTLGVSNMT